MNASYCTADELAGGAGAKAIGWTNLEGRSLLLELVAIPEVIIWDLNWHNEPTLFLL